VFPGREAERFQVVREGVLREKDMQPGKLVGLHKAIHAFQHRPGHAALRESRRGEEPVPGHRRERAHGHQLGV